jgi:hypothetical protein
LWWFRNGSIERRFGLSSKENKAYVYKQKQKVTLGLKNWGPNLVQRKLSEIHKVIVINPLYQSVACEKFRVRTTKFGIDANICVRKRERFLGKVTGLEPTFTALRPIGGVIDKPVDSFQAAVVTRVPEVSKGRRGLPKKIAT